MVFFKKTSVAKLFLLAFSLLINSFSGQTISEWNPLKKNTRLLNELLDSPFDLQKFKKLKPFHSNSGGGNPYSYLYKPSYQGFYYRYFIFDGRPDGVALTTYKKGKEIGGYMDSTEVFIELFSDKTDKDLGKWDLLVYSKKQILEKFGDNYLQFEKTLVYQHNKSVLIFCFDENKSWFKIVRTNKPFKDLNEISKHKTLLKPFKL